VRGWIGLFLLAFLPALVYALFGEVPRADDSEVYWRLGRTLAETGSYTENGAPAAYWPPGMPAFLALVFNLFGESQTALTVINLILHALILVFTARLGTMLGGPRIGAAAMLLCGLLWDFLRQPPLVLSELPYTALLLGLFILLFSFRGRARFAAWFVAGVLLGLATLMRTTAMLWLPFALGCVVVWPWWGWRRKVLPAALLAIAFAGFLIPVGLWTARNYRIYDFFFPISLNSGENLGLSNNRFGGIGYWRHGDPRREIVGINSTDPVVNYHAGRAEFYRTWQTMPLESLLRCIPRLYFTTFKFQPWFANRELGSNPLYEVIMTTFTLQWHLWIVLIIAGFAFTRGPRSSLELAVLCLLVYWLLLHSMILTDPRYRFPIVPFVLPYAGHFLVNVVPEWKKLLQTVEKSPV
jgi:4-amino-4-deoxy-L-arabinose transferase-like glycosyltransferase